MNSRSFALIPAAVSAVVLNMALAGPTYAQVKAALIRDVDRPAAQPVNGRCLTGRETLASVKCALYTVPAGKRLVVETVAYEAYTSAGSVVSEVAFGQDAGGSDVSMHTADNVYGVTPVLLYEQGFTRAYGAAQPLRMYIEENQTLVAGGYRTGNTYATWFLSFSGYLVDK